MTITDSPEKDPSPMTPPDFLKAKPGANSRQEGGNHYKQFTVEPWDAILNWGLGYLDGNAVKYLARWRHRGGVSDLRKAIHYIEKLIEEETK